MSERHEKAQGRGQRSESRSERDRKTYRTRKIRPPPELNRLPSQFPYLVAPYRLRNRSRKERRSEMNTCTEGFKNMDSRSFLPSSNNCTLKTVKYEKFNEMQVLYADEVETLLVLQIEIRDMPLMSFEIKKKKE
jgi:hypothetical protein